MDADRRDSLRRDVRLPFRWQALDAPATSAELAKLFDLPPVLQLSPRLAELEAEYAEVAGNVSEPSVALALDVMNARVSAIAEALFAQHPVPAEQDLEVAAGGIAFTAATPLSEASWVGVHMVLPTCYHVLCAASVRRCARTEGGYRVATELLPDALEPAASKRLSRFVFDNN